MKARPKRKTRNPECEEIFRILREQIAAALEELPRMAKAARDLFKKWEIESRRRRRGSK